MSEVISNNYESNHQAIDIVSSDHTETDIIALESGIVETVVKNKETTDHNSKGLDTYGNYIKIKQTNGKTALYAHMKYGSINLNIGDFVEKGAIIGTMGETGNAYGKHLHLEIKNENGLNENPIVSLNTPTQTQTIKQNKEKSEPEKTKEKNMENIKEDENNNKEEKKAKTNEKEEVIINTSSNNITDESQTTLLINNTYKYGSIVDALKEIKIDSSYSYREKLALENGITNYHGSYNQNVKLLKLLKEGKLKKA